MNHQNYFVDIQWGTRLARYGDVARLIADYLQMLRSLHPEFAAWQLYIPGGSFSAAA